jgi:hypothetical protein
VSSKNRGISGHTVYMPDTLFKLVMDKAWDRDQTISEFVTWALEGHFGLRKRTPGDASDAA